MRIRRLLFVFAFLLFRRLDTSVCRPWRCPQLSSSGCRTRDEGNRRCESAHPKTPSGSSQLRPEERDYLIRTIAFEASGEPEEGKAAVAHVILNRKMSGRWGDNIKDVVTYPWQFEPWMTRRREMESLSPNDPRYQSAAQIADAVLSGQMSDPTAGATHFLNPTIVRQRQGGSLPSWARGEGQPIGRHTFYSPNEGYAVLSIGLMPNATFLLKDRGSAEAPTGHVYGCGQDALTARSPDLPTEDLVQFDAR